METELFFVTQTSRRWQRFLCWQYKYKLGVSKPRVHYLPQTGTLLRLQPWLQLWWLYPTWKSIFHFPFLLDVLFCCEKLKPIGQFCFAFWWWVNMVPRCCSLNLPEDTGAFKSPSLGLFHPPHAPGISLESFTRCAGSGPLLQDCFFSPGCQQVLTVDLEQGSSSSLLSVGWGLAKVHASVSLTPWSCWPASADICQIAPQILYMAGQIYWLHYILPKCVQSMYLQTLTDGSGFGYLGVNLKQEQRNLSFLLNQKQ